MNPEQEATRPPDYKLLMVTSPVFKDNEFIPVRYTCEGDDISPPLHVDHIPESAKSMVLIMDDPDAPSGMWVHWIVWNIPVTNHIKENHIPGKEGINDFERHHYGGPCPPAGTHRYFFKVYALDDVLDLPDNTMKTELERVMADHIIGFGELIGLYKRKN